MSLVKWSSGALLSVIMSQAQAIGVAVTIGDGVSDLTPYRVGLLWDVMKFAEKENSHWRATWEVSGAYWRGNSKTGDVSSNRQLTAFSTGPQLRWVSNKTNEYGLQPYLELGIGATWLSKREVGGYDLGMHFQFEDRLGVGMYMPKGYDVNLRAVHYSNASLHSDNDGINMLMVSFGRWF